MNYTQSIYFVVEVMLKLWLQSKHIVRHSDAHEKFLHIKGAQIQLMNAFTNISQFVCDVYLPHWV